MGQDRFTCTFCLLLSFTDMNLQRRERKVDLLHVVLLSFLFQDLPGLWPLTKNRVYWIRFRWFVIALIESTHKKLPREMQQCISCEDVSETMIHGVIYYSLYQNHGENPLDFSQSCWVSCGPELHFCIRDTVNILTWLIFLFLLVSKKLKANIKTNI